MRTALAAALAFAGAAAAQPAPPKPQWLYAYDLKVRKGGDPDWDKAVKLGVEVSKLPKLDALLAVSQAGFLAVMPAKDLGAKTTPPDWLFGHDVLARKADEDKFTPATAKFGIEVWKDGGTGQLLYLSQAGSMAFAEPTVAAANKDLEWHHAMSLKVRKRGEEAFGPNTRKFGVEAYKDLNTGGLVYVTEAGLIAACAAPAAKPAPNAVKKPNALHGYSLRVRKADEPDFTDKTQWFGVEVLRDENTGGLLYISEAGAIAAVPAPAEVKTKQGDPEWVQAMVMKVRPAGELKSDKTNRFGVEVFRDKNTGYLIFISDVGGIAVLPAK